ncbi:MAG: hypothetical protein H6978_04380 [Gammaproteobacteria bacterium]|nr:hypothetical protein [Gammaproteobacteria bacterium]
MDAVGPKAIYVTAFGYLSLISFTWPHGFLPLISVQALPVVLLSLTAIFIVLLVILFVLFLPFSMLTDKEFLRGLLYNPMGAEDDEKYKDKNISIPVRQLFVDLRATHGWFVAVAGFASLALVLGFSFFCWFAVASEVSEPLMLIVWSPLIWVAYKSLAGLFSADSFEKSKLPIAGVGFFFIFIPSFMFGGTGGFGPGPNPLVRDALRLASIGGGISVVVDPASNEIAESLSSTARLLFYDGHKAWLKSCVVNDPHVWEVEISAIAFRTDETRGAGSCEK